MRFSRRMLAVLVILVPLFTYAAVTVTVNGSNHTIPQTNEKGWGANVTAWIQAISQYTLQPSGGTFTLTADTDFGANYGLKSTYFKSRAANLSTAGIFRMGNNESIGWRNAANSGNILLKVNTSDQLEFNGSPLLAGGLGSIVDADINASANIADTKLATISTAGKVQNSATTATSSNTASAIVARDASGNFTAGTITATLSGNASTASAFDHSPLGCGANAFAYGIGSNGDLVCSSVANAATTATSSNTNSAIVARDGSGNFSAGTITANLTGNVTGNSSTATALAANPSDCSAGQYATTIDASGNLTCAQVATSQLSGNINLGTQVTGALGATNGGTGQTSWTTGDIPYASATNTVSKLGIGSSGDVLTVSGGVPAWVTPSSAPSQSYELSNLGLAVSVAANAMTIAIKQADGSSDPTAGAPVKIGFRSTTAASGAYSQATATAATSLVISSGSTLGTASGVTHYVYVYAINNSGTIELAASLSEFDEGSLQSSTAEGGAGAADSNAVLYSTTARTSKAIRLIGRITTSQATAGTWASSPTEVALAPFKPVNVTARYDLSAAQTISNNSTTILNFDSRSKDSHSSVTTGASWKFTAPVSGEYRVSTFIEWVGNSTGQRNLSVYKNGAIYKMFAYAPSPGANNIMQNGTTTVSLLAGEYIDLRVYQNSGGNLNVGSSTSIATYNSVSIERVGN